MKVLSKNFAKGFVKLMPEHADDLWYLHSLIEPGDEVTGQSEYKYKIPSGGEKTKVAKKQVWVRIKVEKSDFDAHRLRVSGTVVDGSEEVPRGSHHGLDIGERSEVTLGKTQWLSFHRERLEEALSGGAGKVLVLLFDRERALFCTLNPTGYETLLDMKGDVPRKGLDEEKQHRFYHEITGKLQEFVERKQIEHIIAASPSFWKEYLSREIPPELEKKVIWSPVSGVDPTALNELVRRPELQQALQGERAAREAALIEEAMQALSRERLAYGRDDVQQAISDGNAKRLLVSESLIRKSREDDSFHNLEGLMRQSEEMGGEVRMITTEDAQRKLDGLGGLAAVRRW